MALELGPCQVEFNSVDLGKTQGGVKVSIKDDSVDLKSDQNGTAPEDTVITGTIVEVEASFAEVGFDLLSTVLNQSKIGASSGLVGESNVGTSLLSIAQELILTKYSAGIPSTANIDRIVFPKAAPVGNIELTFDAENQRVANVMFKCFPSSVTANWGEAGTSAKTVTYYFGDEAAVA